MEENTLFDELRGLSPEALEAHYQHALDRFIDHLKIDPNVIAVILAGSFAYDKVWYKSDMDMAVIVRDQKLDRNFYTLEENGVMINLGVYTRTSFRQAMQRGKGGGGMHSMYAKGKVVYTTDPSLEDFMEDLRYMGEDDRALTFFTYSSWLLGLMEKVEKWIVVKDNLLYAQYYILKCADVLADMWLIAHGLPPNRESVIRVLELDPDFMGRYYVEPMSGALSREVVMERLSDMTRFLEDHIDWLSDPATQYLEDGEVKTTSMIAKQFGDESVYHTFDFLAERGIVERVTQTIRITPKGKKNLEELAYLYIGGAML